MIRVDKYHSTLLSLHLKQSFESIDNIQLHTSPGEFTEGGPAEEDIAHKRHRTESDMVLMDIETEEQEEE